MNTKTWTADFATAVRARLSGVDNIWYASISAVITAWNRLLSQFQLYAHAVSISGSTSDWLVLGMEYRPFEKDDAKYLQKLFHMTQP